VISVGDSGGKSRVINVISTWFIFLTVCETAV
jgi:hypothetical protein